MKELTELRNKILYLRNTEELSVKGELILLHKLNALQEAINYTHCCTELPDELQPVIAKIEHTNSLGISNYWEVVYYDNKNWHSYQGSKTFEDGEKVVKWNYCKAIV